MFVDIVDDDKAGLDIRQLTDAFTPDFATEVLEGPNGFVDYYEIALTRAPSAGETVTVTLLTDSQLSAVADATGLATLTFNDGNWMTPQLVRVPQPMMAWTVSSSPLSFTNSVEATCMRVSRPMRIRNWKSKSMTTRTPMLIVQETEGSTLVVNGTGVSADNDSYRIRLTTQPGGPVTLTLRTDTPKRNCPQLRGASVSSMRMTRTGCLNTR